MAIRAVYFDLGGVIVRTEDKAPRTALGVELGKSYREMDIAIFENRSSLEASIGKITEDQHWLNVVKSLNLPESEMPRVRDAFFAGDKIDWNIVNFLRGLRGPIRTGLISNAWSGLRPWMVSQKFDDAFDHITISAEVGMMKPDAGIYQHALEKLGVKAKEAVFVDDVEKNVAACEALGMQGVLFQTAEQALADVKKLLG
jgi:epoxide hydrolase-like predicted phosphatase